MNLKPYVAPDPEHEQGGQFPYKRSSLSSWMAVAAMAFAFILLGGFIKTYRQLQDLQEETRHEIAELRRTIRRLQSASPGPQAVRAFDPDQNVRGDQGDVREGRSSRRVTDSMASPADGYRSESPGNATESTIADLPPFDAPEERKIRYNFGRQSNIPSSRALLSPSGGPCQVISVSAGNRRVMIEGGQDLSLREGMRLELCRDGRWIGDLRVFDVFDNQSSCEVLYTTNQPEPGDTVRMPEKSM